MQTRLLYNILTAKWMISPSTANAALPLYKDILLSAKYRMEGTAAIRIECASSIGNRQYPSIPANHRINVVNLNGVMMREDTECEYGTETMASRLREADIDPNCIGHIIKIDSGGGAADAVPPLAEAIKACNKPVLAYVKGSACSAAMYVASYCGHIMAQHGRNEVGCIGTMVQIAGYPSQTTFEDGLVYVRIYADPSDEKNLEYEKALSGDFSPIRENVLNPLAEDFRRDVKANRPAVTDDQLKGRTYFAQDTIGTLIDAIGTMDDAVEKVIDMSNLTITEMEGLQRIQSIESCRDLQSVDGCVSLNGQQLQDIEDRLAHGDEIDTVRQSLDQQTTENDQLRTENARLQADLESRDQQIVNLNAALDARKQQPLAEPVHNGGNDPAADNSNPSEFCKSLINRNNG